MRYALIIVLSCTVVLAADKAATPRAQVSRTQLAPRVQIDLLTADRASALTLSNGIATIAAANVPKAERTTPVTVFVEPAGGWRIHAILEYDFGDTNKATAVLDAVKLQRLPAVHGRIVQYCQPEEFTDLRDWAGADRDPRAKRIEVQW